MARTQEPMRLVGGAVAALGVLPAIAMFGAFSEGSWLLGGLLAAATISVEALGWATWAGYEPDVHELKVSETGVRYERRSAGELEEMSIIDDSDITAVDLVERLNGDYSVVVRGADATVRLALSSAADAVAVRGCLMTTLPSMDATATSQDWTADTSLPGRTA